ncbi:AAA family ATPase [Kineococcus aurantiacus]|uniref:AAA family ATPase n=1 Tax=Kineococcus aurantiacus TaxID=37633 RepID=UPI0031E2266A
MKLVKARLRDYRPISDTGEFDVEPVKTIIVGPNEAGKTAVLRALQTIQPPADDATQLDALRDYPRSRYSDITTSRVDPSDVEVAVATFALDQADVALLRELDANAFEEAQQFELTRCLDNELRWSLPGVKSAVTFSEVEKDLARLRAHLTKQEGTEELLIELDALTAPLRGTARLEGRVSAAFDSWLTKILPLVDEDDAKAEAQFDRVRSGVRHRSIYLQAWAALKPRIPTFVYYSSFFTVRPRIHLAQLAARQEAGDIDDEYDFGNLCLLKLLGFTARQLSNLAAAAPPDTRPGHQSQEVYQQEVLAYHRRLDERQAQLNAASSDLTRRIRRVWGDENVTLRFVPDGQYLKVVVVDDLGVEVELDQRSEGFRWLVSFYIVFTAQAQGDLKNSILLLDEPGLSLHALKQQEFRKTLTLLGEDNQILYTTHSPFMVGSDELHLVRIAEMKDRETGTKVHTTLMVDDPASVYPLQAALGYELAQSLFAQKRNLVCEGLTDLWYLEGASGAARAAGQTGLREDLAIVPAHSASKVIYYSTVLHSQKLKVAALLDSDSAGEKAASQDDLVRMLKRGILRTKDFYQGTVNGPEVEDLFRDTLITVASSELGWDVSAQAEQQPTRRIVDIFQAHTPEFSKYKLAKAFLNWLSKHDWSELPGHEAAALIKLFAAVNKAVA